MKYNIYRKSNYINDPICVYAKIKTGYSYKYDWICVKDLNCEFYKHCTEASLNIFKAKQIINNEKTLDKQYNEEDTFEYCVREVKD